AQLPPPGELLKILGQSDVGNAPRPSNAAAPATDNTTGIRAVASSGQILTAATPQVVQNKPLPKTFADAVALFETNREAILHGQLYGQVQVVNYAPGRMELHLLSGLPR
ncbi:MAG TPA: hypothetical protein DIS76_06935, partial [Rhodospirillaceae bacterium]|nr:hypothetical protein [Rhodospirillaceae bacterium]